MKGSPGANGLREKEAIEGFLEKWLFEVIEWGYPFRCPALLAEISKAMRSRSVLAARSARHRQVPGTSQPPERGHRALDSIREPFKTDASPMAD